MGSLTAPRRIDRGLLTEELQARFLSHVVKTDGCWIWDRPDPNGYGRIGVAGKVRLAHRLSYELFVGPIPEGLTIDHLCRNRACVRPGHLEPCTFEENSTRGARARMRCANGHPWNEENTLVTFDNGGRRLRRVCRACNRKACHRYNARVRRAA